MPAAIFVVPITEGGPQLDVAQLVTEEPADGRGYAVIGQVPSASTCLCVVWTTEDVLDELMADETYAFVEDLPEPEEAPALAARAGDGKRDVPPGKDKAKRQRKSKAGLTAWLTGKGHAAANVARHMAGNEVDGLCKLHSVTEAEYSAAGGTLAE